jgi:uncharacterized membrane protein YbhN (UPF0104 family)
VKQQFIKVVSSVLTISAVIFGFIYLRQLYAEIASETVTYRPTLVVLSVVFFCAFYMVLSFHWRRVCKKIDIDQESQWLTFFASQPYKYLPTSLFTFSFRAKYAKDLGMSLKDSSKAQLVENINMLSTGAGIGLVSYLLYSDLYYTLIFLLVLAAGFIYFLPSSFELKLRSKKVQIIKREWLINMSLTSIAWIVAGLSFMSLSAGLGVNLTVFEAVSASSLAYTLGIIAFFAPGGIGVREWIFALFNIASVTVLAWRILTFLADMLLGFIGIAFVHKKRQKLER